MSEEKITQAAQTGCTESTGLTDMDTNQKQNVNKEVPLLFMRETELFGDRRPDRSEWIQHVEMFKAIGNRINVSHISGLQRVRGMWRIYLDNLDDKVKLMTEGIPLRGKTIPVLNTNPDRLDGEQTTRIRVKNIPLSADDGVIKRVITLKGVEIISVIREKLRVDNKLTNCETGDRLVIVKTSSLKEPLPNFMTFGSFTGKVLHPGQPKHITTSKILKCTKCLQEGHTFANCENDWVCTDCKTSGHKRADCHGVNTQKDETESSESENSDEESESESPATPKQQTTSKTPVPNNGSKSNNSPRRTVRAERNRRQQSMDRFVTPLKVSATNGKTDRSPPTPAEELHDKITSKSKKKHKKNR